MSLGAFIFLIFAGALAFIVLGEAAVSWIFNHIIPRGVESVVVPKEDAEALLGRWHKGWRLWFLRLSSLAIILALLVALLPWPRSPTKWAADKLVDRMIDKGVNAAKRRVPGNGSRSEKVRNGLDRGAERARNLYKPK